MAIQEDRGRALSPVTNVRRLDVVVDAIRRAMLRGELSAGQRVKEAPLAQTLAVSRPTLRQAIDQLVHEGSLVATENGFHVAQPTAEDLLHVAEVRVGLETLAAQRLALAPDGPGMRQLREALRAHLEALESGNLVRGHLTHLDLHRTLWLASGNRMLARIWPLVESQIGTVMSLDQATRHDVKRDAELHVRLVKVIAAGDPARIADEVREHIWHSAGEMVRMIHDDPHSDGYVGSR